MGEKVTRVRLGAQVDEYEAAMLRAARATRTVGTEAERMLQKKQAFETMGRSLMVSGGLMAAGVGLAVKKFADFDQAMSNVAATGKDARDNMQALRDAAIDAGARTVYSATESANAIEEMAKAGVDATDILGGGLNGALDLAAAGGLGVADAAGIAATALKTFKLEGRDMSHVADLLAAGAGKAMGDVQDLSLALRQGGQAAALTGLSIEETTAALSAFASQGLLGSDAGTSLKTMLLNLNPSTKKAADLVREYNIEAFDQQGNFIGLAEYAGKLQAALGSMSAEQQSATLKTIFGTDAYRAAAVVLDEGESGIRDWIKAVDDQGYAAETARTRLDNLKGDWEALSGAVDSAMITMGAAADGPLRFIVQGLTDVVDQFNDMPDAAQQVVFGLGAAASAATLAGGAYLLAVPKIADFKVALDVLGPSAQRAARNVGLLARVGAVGAAIGVVTYGVDALSEAIAEGLLPSADKIDVKMRQAKSGIDLFAAALEKEGITDTRQATDLLANLGDELDRVADSSFWNPASTSGTAVTVAKELAEIAATGDMELFADQFRRLGEDAELTERQMRTFIKANPDLESALMKAAQAAGLATDTQSLLKFALGDLQPAAKVAEDAMVELAEEADRAALDLDDMKDALEAVAGTAMSMGSAKDAALSAINAMADAADAEKVSMKGANEESIAFRESIRSVEDAHRKSAEAIIENGGSLKDARAEWQKGRDAVLDTIEPFFKSRDAAERWADKNLGSASDVKGALADVKTAADALPEEIPMTVTADTTQAKNTLQGFINRYGKLQGTINYRATTTDGSVGGRATGGAIYGPGTGTSDSILIRASNGEHMLTAKDVQALGGQAGVYAFRRDLHGGTLAYASGGAITLSRARDAVDRAEARLRAAKTKEAREKAKDELADARADLADVQRSFREELTDWRTGNRRGENRAAGMNGNGLSLVDQLLDLAADTGGSRGAKARESALKREAQYLRLEKAADAAADKVSKSGKALQSLRDASEAVVDRVSQVVRGLFDLARIGATKTEEIEKTRRVARSMQVGDQTISWFDVEKYTETVTTKPTVKSILSDTRAAAKGIKAFADKLKRLAAMGLNSALLEEIASLGVENGTAMADALLTATSGEISDLNAYYRAVGKYSDQAGQTVADAGYKKLIEAAERQLAKDQEHADAIRKQLKDQTDRIIKTITDLLKSAARRAGGGPIHGPGTSTSDSIFLWASDDEHMWSAADVDRWGGHENVAALRAGRYIPTAPRFTATAPSVTQGSGERVVVDQRGATFYAYDPTEGARKNKEHLTRVLDARGI